MREYGSEHPGILLPDGYFKSFEHYGHCNWLRSGREALYLVARNVKPEDEIPVVLMPAYCCHSMIDPFEKAGWRVEYYALNEDLTADLDSLSHLLVSLRPAAALTMNYYGSAFTLDAVAYVKCGFPECICIEDFSHCTFSLSSIHNPEVDYYVSSIRKMVGVCDGSVIISKQPVSEDIVEEGETEFTRARRDYQRLKSKYNYTHDTTQKNVFFPGLKQQEGVLDAFEGVHRISRMGKAMLEALNGEQIAYARQKNMAHLLEILDGKVETVPGIDRSLAGAPFALPILVDDRDNVQRRLAGKGVYAPVLWPICDEARSTCSVSARMADKMLAIPIDQRYNWDDIEDIAKIIISVIS